MLGKVRGARNGHEGTGNGQSGRRNPRAGNEPKLLRSDDVTVTRVPRSSEFQACGPGQGDEKMARTINKTKNRKKRSGGGRPSQDRDKLI